MFGYNGVYANGSLTMMAMMMVMTMVTLMTMMIIITINGCGLPQIMIVCKIPAVL